MTSKHILATILLVIMLFSAGASAASNTIVIDPRLETLAAEKEENEFIPVIVVFDNPVSGSSLLKSIEGMKLHERRRYVINTKKNSFIQNSGSFEKWLSERQLENQVKNAFPLWVCNSYTFLIKAGKIDELGELQNVTHVLYDAPRTISEITDAIDEEIEVVTEDTDRISDGVELIEAPYVWEMGVWGHQSIVGLMDTGVDFNHSDLHNNIWVNENEIPGNGIDDDNNGYIDDINGWNFVDDTPAVNDIQGHGTKSAGVVAGDGTGGDTTGVAPKAKIMILRIYQSTTNSNARMLLAIQYGIDNGANIMASSISYDWNPDNLYVDYVLQRQTQETLLAAGMLQANSTGNDGDHLATYPIPWNISAPANCPPPWHHPDQTLVGGISGMIAVGSGNDDGSVPSYSDHGPSEWNDPDYPAEFQDYPWEEGESLGLIRPDVVAPRSVRTTRRYGGYYSSYNGTSASSPHVSGALALLHDAHQQALPEELAEALLNTAVDYGDEGKDNRSGCGMINVHQALLYLDENIGTGGLEIYVHDGQGNPVPGAYIVVGEEEVIGRGQDNGLASLLRIQPDTYDIIISAEGYEDYIVEDLVITEDEIQELVIPLEEFYFYVDPQVVNTTMFHNDTLDLQFFLDGEGFEGALFELSLEPLTGLDWDNDYQINIFDHISGDYQVDAVNLLNNNIVIAGYNGTESPQLYRFDLERNFVDSLAQPSLFGDAGLDDWTRGVDGSLMVLAREKVFIADDELNVSDSLGYTFSNASSLAYDLDNELLYTSDNGTTIKEFDNQGNETNTWETSNLIRSLEYFKDDALGSSLYILHNGGTGFATISRLNIETGIISEVVDLAPDSLDMGMAMCLNSDFNKPFWTVIAVQQSGVRLLNREVVSPAYSLMDSVRVQAVGATVDLSIFGPQLPISNDNTELSLVWHHVENDWDYRIPVIVHVDENSISDNNAAVEDFQLISAWPNPFNGSVRLTVNLENRSTAKLAIYNILGQLVDTVYEGQLTVGQHAFSWNGHKQASGIYFAVLETRSGVGIKKLMITK